MDSAIRSGIITVAGVTLVGIGAVTMDHLRRPTEVKVSREIAVVTDRRGRQDTLVYDSTTNLYRLPQDIVEEHTRQFQDSLEKKVYSVLK